jgi:hypothetical protein
MRLDKAAQTGVKSSLKEGVMQAVDRELHSLPAPAVLAFIVEGDLYSSSRTSLVGHLVLLTLIVLLVLVAIG